MVGWGGKGGAGPGWPGGGEGGGTGGRSDGHADVRALGYRWFPALSPSLDKRGLRNSDLWRRTINEGTDSAAKEAKDVGVWNTDEASITDDWSSWRRVLTVDRDPWRGTGKQ